MTDIKKKAKGKKGAKAKKLRLTKETLKDLSAGGRGQVKGGRARVGSVAGICLPSQGCSPGTVGALVISNNSLQKQFGQIEAGFRNGFLGLLSDEQKSKLGFIQSVEAALRAAGALHQLGL